MAPIVILFGILMTLLGLGLYAAAVIRGISWHAEEMNHALVRALTALIPAGFGLVLILLGLIARKGSDKTRKHTMHVAALLGLLGVFLPLWRVFKAVTSGNPIDPLPVGGSIAMAVLSGVFLVLCIRSFIQARRARTLNAAQPLPDVK